LPLSINCSKGAYVRLPTCTINCNGISTDEVHVQYKVIESRTYREEMPIYWYSAHNNTSTFLARTNNLQLHTLTYDHRATIYTSDHDCIRPRGVCLLRYSTIPSGYCPSRPAACAIPRYPSLPIPRGISTLRRPSRSLGMLRYVVRGIHTLSLGEPEVRRKIRILGSMCGFLKHDLLLGRRKNIAPAAFCDAIFETALVQLWCNAGCRGVMEEFDCFSFHASFLSFLLRYHHLGDVEQRGSHTKTNPKLPTSPQLMLELGKMLIFGARC
jgi:hypothetical protein